jgi:KaiC/GvpD/RAD55 family RecA-like ATPase
VNGDLEENIISRLNLFEEQGVTEYVSLDYAVDEYIEFSRHPENRVWTGIQPIDEATRGLAPGELAIINGFAHNGKTVLVVEMLIRNEGRPCILFTPDENRVAVLVKLSSAIHGISAEEFERRLNQNDDTAETMLREVAERFRNLAVFDENISLHTMDNAIRSVEETIGKPDFVVFDYADLLNAELDTKEKVKALKRWGRTQRVPLFVIHQSSRTGGAGGSKVTITDGAFGGEQEAFIMIGVRRKLNMIKDQIMKLEERAESAGLSDKAYIKLMERIQYLREDQMPRHKDTITISLVKNKRPPMRLVDDIDFKLDHLTGRLLPLDLRPDEEPPMPLPETFQTGSSARDLLKGK